MTAELPHPQSLDDSLVIDEVERYRRLSLHARPAARAELLTRFPYLAEELNDCLDGLEWLSNWPGVEALEGHDASHTISSNHSLGDFRIVRELGRGGMGVVYEAEQLSLGRRVALKVLPFAAFLDDRRLQRFKQEAQAAAILRHPNIVSVFCVGCERGIHYYAMELVEGCSFADLVSSLATDWPKVAPENEASHSATRGEVDTRPIAALSTQNGRQPMEYYRSVARLGATVAEALHYAHEQGVVHRDVKPSNLLLDARGKPWVTDFGLAQVADDRGLTMSGDLLGTLRYMSPEQSAGKAILDHRTDIYSLGATLFELLTLQPALDAKDRTQLLRQLEQDRPRRARSVDPRVPKDLETILLTAMAIRPEDRYPSAQELATDLRCFLGRKPISARQPGRAHRAIRWIQRHPAQSILLASVALLLAALAMGGPLVAFRYARLAERETANRRELQALLTDTLTSATESLENTPSIDTIHEKLLTDTLRQYERLVVRADQAPDLMFQHASALIRLGVVIELRFDSRRAAEVIERGVQMLERLVRENPQSVDYQFQLAQAYASLGSIMWGVDDSKSIASFRASIDVLNRLVANDSSPPRFRSELALSRLYLGGVISHQGELREAEAIIRIAVSDLERLCVQQPANFDYVHWLAHSKDFLSRLLLLAGREQEASREIREAFALVDFLPPATRYETRVRIGFAAGHKTLAECLRKAKQYDEAEAVLRDGLAELDEVLQGFPDSEWARGESIRLKHEMAENLVSQGRVNEAASTLLSAMDHADRSVRFRDSQPRFSIASSFLFALVRWQQGYHDEAREVLEQILAEAERGNPEQISWIYACSPFPDQRDAQAALTYGQRCPAKPAVKREKALGIAFYRLGRMEDARIHLEQSCKLSAVPDAETLLFFAMTEHALGNDSSARTTWQQVREQVEASCDIRAALVRDLAREAEEVLGLDKR